LGNMMQVNQKQIEYAMKQMGVKQEKIDAEEVIIKSGNKRIIVDNPQVMKISMLGQESLQITGDIKYEETENKENKENDISFVMQQTKCSEKKARAALEKANWDLAKAILDLQKS